MMSVTVVWVWLPGVDPGSGTFCNTATGERPDRGPVLVVLQGVAGLDRDRADPVPAPADLERSVPQQRQDRRRTQPAVSRTTSFGPDATPGTRRTNASPPARTTSAMLADGSSSARAARMASRSAAACLAHVFAAGRATPVATVTSRSATCFVRVHALEPENTLVAGGPPFGQAAGAHDARRRFRPDSAGVDTARVDRAARVPSHVRGDASRRDRPETAGELGRRCSEVGRVLVGELGVADDQDEEQ